MGTEIKLTSSFDKQRKSVTYLLDTALGIQNGPPTGQTLSHENICASKTGIKINAGGNGDKVDWQFLLSTHIVNVTFKHCAVHTNEAKK